MIFSSSTFTNFGELSSFFLPFIPSPGVPETPDPDTLLALSVLLFFLVPRLPPLRKAPLDRHERKPHPGGRTPPRSPGHILTEARLHFEGAKNRCPQAMCRFFVGGVHFRGFSMHVTRMIRPSLFRALLWNSPRLDWSSGPLPSTFSLGIEIREVYVFPTAFFPFKLFNWNQVAGAPLFLVSEVSLMITLYIFRLHSFPILLRSRRPL